MSEAVETIQEAQRRRFPPYPNYKDSGIEWLRQIPVPWEVHRLKYLATANDEVLPESTDPSFEITYVDISSVDAIDGITATEALAFEKAPSRARRIVRKGDVIVSTVRTYLRAIAAIENAERNLTVSTGFAVIRPRRLDSSFASYALRAPYFVERVVANSVGVSYPAINASQLACFPIAYPPMDQQRSIATFLDRETATIDALVAKKERLIELLQEKRTALIATAVTRGLDPNVPLKDSGVEWLGEVPAHWEVLSLKRRAKRIQTGTTPPTSEVTYYEDGTIPWYGPGSFTEDLLVEAPIKLIAQSAVSDGVARIFEQGTSIVVTIGATLGKVGYLERSASFNQQITGVTFDRHHVCPRYGAYQLRAREPVLHGMAPNTTLPILDQEEVGCLPYLIPPVAEQRGIAAFLDREMANIDALVAKVRQAIDRLTEFRTALISAAVTGKIDVREDASPACLT